MRYSLVLMLPLLLATGCAGTSPPLIPAGMDSQTLENTIVQRGEGVGPIEPPPEPSTQAKVLVATLKGIGIAVFGLGYLALIAAYGFAKGGGQL